MKDDKKHTQVISIRLTEQERALIETKAADFCMGASQYLKYKALEENASDQSTKNSSKEQEKLPRHENLLMRLSLAGYLRIAAIAEKILSDEQLEVIQKEEAQEQQKLGINIQKK